MTKEEVLELNELSEGTVLYIIGDDVDLAFRVTMKTPNGPAGILRDKLAAEYVLTNAQILGMIPFNFGVRESLLPLFEPGIIKLNYGTLLVLRFADNGDVETRCYCVSKVSINEPFPE